MTRYCAPLHAALFALAVPLGAQTLAPGAEFLQRARDGTAQYRDRAAAIAAGYRAIGPDAPDMGQHWLNARLLIEGRLDPARPAVLQYATIDGRAVLVGVAYAVPVPDGGEPPADPVGRDAWHLHGGTVEDESMPFSHMSHDARGGMHVAVLHAWIGLPNPAGPFAPANWTLPFARVGLVPPDQGHLTPAAQALSLLSGGDAYYRDALARFADPGSSDAHAVGRLLAECRARVEAWRAALNGRTHLGSGELAELEDMWRQMGASLASVTPVSAP